MKKALVRLVCALGVLAATPLSLADIPLRESVVYKNILPVLSGAVYAYAPAETDAGLCKTELACADDELWTFYQRTRKIDNTGDFAWKDIAAANRAGMPLEDYVIGGMEPTLRIVLAKALGAAEKDGLCPGITSAYRDPWRQHVAKGLKASDHGSYHGKFGYGHGLAVDIVSSCTQEEGDHSGANEKLWKWIDEKGSTFGIERPLRFHGPHHVYDPPHVTFVDSAKYIARVVNTARDSHPIKENHQNTSRGHNPRASFL